MEIKVKIAKQTSPIKDPHKEHAVSYMGVHRWEGRALLADLSSHIQPRAPHLVLLARRGLTGVMGVCPLQRGASGSELEGAPPEQWPGSGCARCGKAGGRRHPNPPARKIFQQKGTLASPRLLHGSLEGHPRCVWPPSSWQVLLLVAAGSRLTRGGAASHLGQGPRGEAGCGAGDSQAIT